MGVAGDADIIDTVWQSSGHTWHSGFWRRFLEMWS